MTGPSWETHEALLAAVVVERDAARADAEQGWVQAVMLAGRIRQMLHGNGACGCFSCERSLTALDAYEANLEARSTP